jgi:acetolactate synthase I/II/III large subunit
MSNAETLSTGQVIARSLIRNGIDTIFGIPGAHTYDLIDALYECRDKIRFIVNRHEQGSGYMAYGYAKSTGRVGAFTCVPGPGVLNAGAALCTAYGANAPCSASRATSSRTISAAAAASCTSCRTSSRPCAG